MNTAKSFHQFLASIGRPELSIHKADGVWYLVGYCDDFDPEKAGTVERCLHVCTLKSLTREMLTTKIQDLI